MIWQHAQFLTAKSRKYEEALFEFKCQKNNGKLEKWYHQLANMQVLKYTSDSVKSQKVLTIFYTPVFRRDVLWYGDVRPGLRPSGSPSVRLSVRPSARFPHFSPTYFDILSWNFAHDFFLMYYRSSLTVVTLHQFLKELCLFVNLEYM